MKAALPFLIAGVALCVLSVRAFAEPYRRVGYEVGVFRWRTEPEMRLEGARHQVLVLSLGRWQRLSLAATWMTRLEYADLTDVAIIPASGIPEHHEWADMGRSTTLQTGLELHPPVKVGLAPYLGANLGVGLAHQGDRHEADDIGGGWSVTTHHRGRLGPAVVAGAEVGLRVFSKRGWPCACATAGFRYVVGPDGAGGAPEPVLSIGY